MYRPLMDNLILRVQVAVLKYTTYRDKKQKKLEKAAGKKKK
jgi:hypothetical protein